MLRIISITLILLSSATLHAQQYQYIFPGGWYTERFIEQDNFSLSIGLSNIGNEHIWLLNKFNKSGKLQSSNEYQFDGLSTSFNNHFNIKMIDSSTAVINGVQLIDDNFSSGLLSLYDLQRDTVTYLDKYAIGYRTFALQTFLLDTNNFKTFGVYLKDSSVNQRRISSYLRIKKNGNISILDYSCSGFISYGGCDLVFKNAVPMGAQIIFACQTQAYESRNIQDGLIIKVDSMGKEQWRLAIENDSTTCHNLLIAPLANGNFLATWQDYYYKPFKSPTNNRYPESNKNTTIWCAEFSTEGQIIRTWNLQEALRYKGTPPEIAFHNHLIVSEDSNIIIVGNTRDYGTNGYDLGYALKLDKFGEYQWLRQYEINISKPDGNGQEKLFLNGVTELKNGSFALAGEYRSDPSDSFPNGTQRGVVLFVDEFGCLEPGCQLTDGVAELQTKQAVFRVYPNPSSGQIEVRSERLDIRLKKIEVFDMQGMLVYSQSSTSSSLTSTISHLSSNLYYLKIYRDDGYTETHKIIKE